MLPVPAMAEDSSEAKWGVAAEDGSAPAEWAASGTLADAVAYANGLSGSTAYIQLQSNVTAGVLLTFTQGAAVLNLNNYTLTGSAMYLTFDLAEEYAGQAFTLVHKKADGTFEYFYATAGADGKVQFGPLYELSPFMLVKGTLKDVPNDDAPKTGDDSPLWIWWLLGGVSAAGIVLLIVLAKRKRQRLKYMIGLRLMLII